MYALNPLTLKPNTPTLLRTSRSSGAVDAKEARTPAAISAEERTTEPRMLSSSAELDSEASEC